MKVICRTGCEKCGAASGCRLSMPRPRSLSLGPRHPRAADGRNPSPLGAWGEPAHALAKRLDLGVVDAERAQPLGRAARGSRGSARARPGPGRWSPPGPRGRGARAAGGPAGSRRPAPRPPARRPGRAAAAAPRRRPRPARGRGCAARIASASGAGSRSASPSQAPALVGDRARARGPAPPVVPRQWIDHMQKLRRKPVEPRRAPPRPARSPGPRAASRRRRSRASASIAPSPSVPSATLGPSGWPAARPANHAQTAREDRPDARVASGRWRRWPRSTRGYWFVGERQIEAGADAPRSPTCAREGWTGGLRRPRHRRASRRGSTRR